MIPTWVIVIEFPSSSKKVKGWKKFGQNTHILFNVTLSIQKNFTLANNHLDNISGC